MARHALMLHPRMVASISTQRAKSGKPRGLDGSVALAVWSDTDVSGPVRRASFSIPHILPRSNTDPGQTEGQVNGLKAPAPRYSHARLMRSGGAPNASRPDPTDDMTRRYGCAFGSLARTAFQSATNHVPKPGCCSLQSPGEQGVSGSAPHCETKSSAATPSVSQRSARGVGSALRSPAWAGRSTGVRYSARRRARSADRRPSIRVCPG